MIAASSLARAEAAPSHASTMRARARAPAHLYISLYIHLSIYIDVYPSPAPSREASSFIACTRRNNAEPCKYQARASSGACSSPPWALIRSKSARLRQRQA